MIAVVLRARHAADCGRRGAGPCAGLSSAMEPTTLDGQRRPHAPQQHGRLVTSGHQQTFRTGHNARPRRSGAKREAAQHGHDDGGGQHRLRAVRQRRSASSSMARPMKPATNTSVQRLLGARLVQQDAAREAARHRHAARSPTRRQVGRRQAAQFGRPAAASRHAAAPATPPPRSSTRRPYQPDQTPPIAQQVQPQRRRPADGKRQRQRQRRQTAHRPGPRHSRLSA